MSHTNCVEYKKIIKLGAYTCIVIPGIKANVLSSTVVPCRIVVDSLRNPICSRHIAQHDSLETNYRDKEVNHQEVSELLNRIRVKNINNIIVAYLNINTFKNKYDFLKTLISENIDVMIIVETKLDDSYPKSQS